MNAIAFFLVAAAVTAVIVWPIWLFWVLLRTLMKPSLVPWSEHLRELRLVWIPVLLAFPLFILAVALFFLLPADGSAREARRPPTCINNLKQLGLALHNYHENYGSFPPAYTSDAQGRPLHSWRVLILPYLEYGSVYNKLHLDEAWDSPHNRAVFDRAFGDKAPPAFRCPGEENSNKQDTSYVMLVGPDTISDGDSATRLDQIADGTSHTAIVVERARSGIPWMEPRDLDVSKMSFDVSDPDARSIRSDHPGVVNVLMADGSARSLLKDVDPNDLKALTTIAGGEDVRQITKP